MKRNFMKQVVCLILMPCIMNMNNSCVRANLVAAAAAAANAAAAAAAALLECTIEAKGGYFNLNALTVDNGKQTLSKDFNPKDYFNIKEENYCTYNFWIEGSDSPHDMTVNSVDYKGKSNQKLTLTYTFELTNADLKAKIDQGTHFDNTSFKLKGKVKDKKIGDPAKGESLKQIKLPLYFNCSKEENKVTYTLPSLLTKELDIIHLSAVTPEVEFNKVALLIVGGGDG